MKTIAWKIGRAVGVVWLVLAATSAAPRAPAHAQAALVPILVQSSTGLCLTVTPPPGHTSPRPAPGWRVIVAPCDGGSRQRWGQVVGDFSDFVFSAGVCAGPAQGSGHGLRTVELVDCDGGRTVLGHQPPQPDGTGQLRTNQEECLTAPGPGTTPEPFLAPCDGRPEQTWRTSSH